MKKIILSAAAVSLCLIFAACSAGKTPGNTTPTDGSTASGQNITGQSEDGTKAGKNDTTAAGTNASGDKNTQNTDESASAHTGTTGSGTSQSTESPTDGTVTGTSSDDRRPLVSLLQNTVDVVDVSEYSGRFTENGTVQEVKNVLAVTLVNKGTQDIRLIEFEVTDDNGTVYNFSATTLFSGSAVKVLEKNGKSVSSGFTAKGIKVTAAAYFSEKPSLNENIFKVDGFKDVINITNVSDDDIKDGYIYYKEYADGEYFGGITYRIKTGEMKQGETKQLSVSGFDPSLHRTVFTTYVK